MGHWAIAEGQFLCFKQLRTLSRKYVSKYTGKDRKGCTAFLTGFFPLSLIIM